jgi:hypothetical protein
MPELSEKEQRKRPPYRPRNVSEPGPPMTLGNMREHGVRRLRAFCENRKCRHTGLVDVDDYPDDAPVPSFGPLMACTQCGAIGAHARPYWGEAPRKGQGPEDGSA